MLAVAQALPERVAHPVAGPSFSSDYQLYAPPIAIDRRTADPSVFSPVIAKLSDERLKPTRKPA